MANQTIFGDFWNHRRVVHVGLAVDCPLPDYLRTALLNINHPRGNLIYFITAQYIKKMSMIWHTKLSRFIFTFEFLVILVLPSIVDKNLKMSSL